VSRRGLTAGGGLAAALVVAALLLLGGDSDDSPGTTTGEPTTQSSQATEPTGTATAVASDIVLSDEERDGIAATLALVETGGPFTHDQDGSTFQNREGHLPDQPEGYYREYTVETPGSDDRGARRLVIGENGETYYTADHYDSFTRIDPEDFK
jgi:ribonuclease T1